MSAHVERVEELILGNPTFSHDSAHNRHSSEMRPTDVVLHCCL